MKYQIFGDANSNECNPFTTKWTCYFDIKDGVSHVRAIVALSKLCGFSLEVATFVLKNTRQLCFLEMENFREIVLSIDEVPKVKEVLEPYFTTTFNEAGQQVLPFGCCVYPPWRRDRTRPVAAS